MTNGKKSTDREKPEQPLDVLGSMTDKEIFIRLMDRTEVVGRLRDFDSYMNLKIHLEERDLLIRGNNIALIATEWQDK